MKRLTQCFYLTFVLSALIVAGCSRDSEEEAPAVSPVRESVTKPVSKPTEAWSGQFYWTTGAKGEPLRKLVPWQPIPNPCPPGFWRFRMLYPRETSSAKSTGETAGAAAETMIRNPQLVCVAFANFESNPKGGFVPTGWCFWFSNRDQGVFVRIDANDPPEVDQWKGAGRRPFRPLPPDWLDSSTVLQLAEKNGWGVIKNLTAPGVGSMRLQMTTPGPVNAPSVPMWQTPFVSCQMIGEKKVTGNIFVHGTSGEIFFSSPLFPAGVQTTDGRQSKSTSAQTPPRSKQKPPQSDFPIPIRTRGTLGEMLLDGTWVARLDKFIIDVDAGRHGPEDVHKFQFVVGNPLPQPLKFDTVIATTFGQNGSRHITRFENQYKLEFEQGVILTATVPFGTVSKPQKFVLEIQQGGRAIGGAMTHDVSHSSPTHTVQ